MSLTDTESPAAVADHQAQRERRLRWATTTSFLVRPLAVLIPIVVVPVFARYLGAERYGLYEAIASLAIWIGLSNIGLGFGLSNRLMDCYVSGDRDMARRYVSTLFVAMMGLLIAGTLAISAICFAVDWGALFNATPEVRGPELRWAVWLACMVPLLGVVFNMAPAIHTAYQEIHYQNAWEGIAKVATFLACLAVPWTGLGIPGAIIAISGVPVVVGLLNHLHLWFRRKPWLRPSITLFRMAHLRSLVQDGIILFVLQSSIIFMFQADRLVIGTLRTPEEVAQYSVLNRLFMLGYGAFALMLMPLWPAYGEAFRRGDRAWCRRKLKLTLLLGVSGMLAFGLVLAATGDGIVRLLVGDMVSCPPLIVIAGMTAGFCLRAWADSHGVLLNGAKVLAPQVAVLGGNAVLAIALNLLLTSRFGIVGTAWSYPLAALITTVWGYPWLVRRFFARGA